jgi:uncharacterized membrane protein
MTNNTSKQRSSRLTSYWITTGLLTFGMLAGGIGQLAHAKRTVDGIVHLGFPPYFLTILGTWKILGVIALLVPGYRLLKEWAYAGFFFAMTGAIASHLASGDGIKEIASLTIFVILICLSWMFRPQGRRIVTQVI